MKLLSLLSICISDWWFCDYDDLVWTSPLKSSEYGWVFLMSCDLGHMSNTCLKVQAWCGRTLHWNNHFLIAFSGLWYSTFKVIFPLLGLSRNLFKRNLELKLVICYGIIVEGLIIGWLEWYRFGKHGIYLTSKAHRNINNILCTSCTQDYKFNAAYLCLTVAMFMQKSDRPIRGLCQSFLCPFMDPIVTWCSSIMSIVDEFVWSVNSIWSKMQKETLTLVWGFIVLAIGQILGPISYSSSYPWQSYLPAEVEE